MSTDTTKRNTDSSTGSHISGRLAGITPQGLYDKCMALASNLWWSWHPEVINLFRSLDPIRWRQLGHNPIALLREFTPERLEIRAAELVLYTRIDQAYRRMTEYMNKQTPWARRNVGVLGSQPVAYFSLEFGVHESVPIYSGGLGVLSGDHIKSASGLGVPLVAVGLFYNQGYFKQHLDINGWQQEEYLDTMVEYLPLEPATDSKGSKITVSIQTRTGTIYAKVRQMNVGRVRLLLLDTDLEENQPEDRQLTSRLYGGNNRTRIRQEIVSGIGGIRALKVLGITPGVYHLNEGHNAFATLEAVRQRMNDDGVSFDTASSDIAQKTVFTTHTPVPAGHDRFDSNLIEEHLGPLRDELKIDHSHLMSLGRVDPSNNSEPFCMTVLGLKMSRYANAVASLHGVVSRKMWHCLWPHLPEEKVPIGHITNGVHVPSWMAWQINTLFERHLSSSWSEESYDPKEWEAIQGIDPGELWETHSALKNLLVAFVRRRISRQCRRRGEADEMIDRARTVLDPQILTIGFGRRFATYKRATLVLNEIDRMAKICNDLDRPVQFIFAGKAHPADQPGKEFIQTIANLRGDQRFANRFVFIEDYDINVCRHMVQGVDVWLNNPRRPLEASGTSGMKAVLNGALNLSVLDGWWAEAYDGTNGFAIGNGTSHVDDSITDQRDAASLFDVIENEVVPLYYDIDEHGLPARWIKRMMNSISTLAWRFSAHRMVADYTTEAYLPAAGGTSCQMER
ncbi:MAG: alpha-glucan family phosphorylase [Planctomycetaceae bacterium]|jgi:starch phosphorylase|nr:alpha-glucan family phosphorylase [Planctomycetaceae bacterium]